MISSFVKNILQLLLCMTLINVAKTGNILVMVPFPSKSHTMNFMPIVKELAARGHNVTVVSPYPQEKPVPNLTDIVVPDLFAEFLNLIPSMKDLIDGDTLLFRLTVFWINGLHGTEKALQLEPIQKLIKDTDSKFDLIITEAWFTQEPFVAFGHKFNAPVISIITPFLYPLTAQFTGNHLPLAYVPLFKNGFNDRMSFLQRVINTFFYYWDVITGELYFLNKQEALMRKYFIYPGSEKLPPLRDMLRNTSLTLSDHNAAVGYPVPLHSNIVPFGGINVKSPGQLPADLQKIMDNAKSGVIYLSFGSFFNISVFKPELQDVLMSALGKSKQTILMKLEDATILEKYPYKNIILKSWFPQASVLAHPNCKVFITHAGLHGLIEGLYNKVPLLAIPLFTDQKYNAKFIETVKIGLQLDRDEFTEEEISIAIDSLINNAIYKENIKERSAIFKETIMNTMDNVIYWIEFVIRHKGAPHLRPAVVDLHWYQYQMIDVFAFYILTIFLMLYIIKFIVIFLIKCIRCLFSGKRVSNKNIAKSKEE